MTSPCFSQCVGGLEGGCRSSIVIIFPALWLLAALPDWILMFTLNYRFPIKVP